MCRLDAGDHIQGRIHALHTLWEESVDQENERSHLSQTPAQRQSVGEEAHRLLALQVRNL